MTSSLFVHVLAEIRPSPAHFKQTLMDRSEDWEEKEKEKKKGDEGGIEEGF